MIDDLTGAQLGEYQILGLLGRGGMATVYRGYQPCMDRQVAIKVLSLADNRGASFIARFRQEARVAASLEHPHIVPVYDYGEAGGCLFLVSRLVSGGSLADRLAGQPLPPKQTLAVLRELADALDYAHSRGVVHRDVKPANVLMDERGHCLLADFGLARLAEGGQHFTQTGRFVGTPHYASPEQGLGRPLDGRGDLYSLGVMLFEMSTGHRPFDANTPMEVLVMHIHAPIPPPASLNPSLSPDIVRVIEIALAKDPDKRFQTGTRMVQMLEAAARLAPAPATMLDRALDAGVAGGGYAVPRPVAQEATLLDTPSPAYRAPTPRRAPAPARPAAPPAMPLPLNALLSAAQPAPANAPVPPGAGRWWIAGVAAFALLMCLFVSGGAAGLVLRGGLGAELLSMGQPSVEPLRTAQVGEVVSPVTPSPAHLPVTQTPPPAAEPSATRTPLAVEATDGPLLVAPENASQLVESEVLPHPGYVFAIAWSPDGRQLAVGGMTGSVDVWDVESRAPTVSLSAYDGAVNGLAFSSDGRSLATVGSDAYVSIWSADTGEFMRDVMCQGVFGMSVAMSLDGNALACGGDDGSISLFDFWSGAPLAVLTAHAGPTLSVAFSPDGFALASGGADGQVRIWDVLTGLELLALAGHDDWVRSVAFSADGRLLASGSDDTTVRLWDAHDGAALAVLAGHSDWVRSVAFSPDGRLLASASDDRVVRLWDTTRAAEAASLLGHTDWVRAVAFCPDGYTLASGADDYVVRLWHVSPPH